MLVTRAGVEAEVALNESPSEKEGKLCGYPVRQSCRNPSMKVPPKRKGNLPYSLTGDQVRAPQ